ncbi:hypothetical protein IPN35_04870 [Candidatus Peregrinibacteria bacterium]|nr:MAG: hypothetical protein IPN35_04870 [Candidatus Peregrinibacteria bacterium]
MSKFIVILSFPLLFFLGNCSINTCGNYIMSEKKYENLQKIATAYTRDCGATTAFSPQIKITDINTGNDNIIFILKKSPSQDFNVIWKEDTVEIYFDFSLSQSDILKKDESILKIKIFSEGNEVYFSKPDGVW